MSQYVLIHGELYNYDELYHYGVKGMRWGHRKKQEPTSDIRKRYDSAKAEYKQAKKEYSRAATKASNRSIAAISPIKKHRQADKARWDDVVKKAERANAADAAYKQAKRDYKTSPEGKAAAKARAKKAIKIGAAVAGTALAAYGTYKAAKYIKEVKRIRRGQAAAQKLLEAQRESETFMRKVSELTKSQAHGSYRMGSRYVEW